MNPQDYSARTAYRPPAPWDPHLNRIGVPLTSLGLAPRDAVSRAEPFLPKDAATVDHNDPDGRHRADPPARGHAPPPEHQEVP